MDEYESPRFIRVESCLQCPYRYLKVRGKEKRDVCSFRGFGRDCDWDISCEYPERFPFECPLQELKVQNVTIITEGGFE